VNVKVECDAIDAGATDTADTNPRQIDSQTLAGTLGPPSPARDVDPSHVTGGRRDLIGRPSSACPEFEAGTRQARCGIDPHDAFLTCRHHGQRYRLAMTPSMDRTAAFRELHQAGTFVLPNPWDVGSAKYVASLGFKALASTSAGFAWTLGKADGEVTLEEKLAHLRAIVEAVDVPINADFEGGFAVEPEGVAAVMTKNKKLNNKTRKRNKK